MGIASAGGAGRVFAEWMVAGNPTSDLWPVDIRRFASFNANIQWLRNRVKEVLGLYYAMPSRTASSRVPGLSGDLQSTPAPGGQRQFRQQNEVGATQLLRARGRGPADRRLLRQTALVAMVGRGAAQHAGEPSARKRCNSLNPGPARGAGWRKQPGTDPETTLTRTSKEHAP